MRFLDWKPELTTSLVPVGFLRMPIWNCPLPELSLVKALAALLRGSSFME